jgi:phosphatidylserine decarboxylase
MNYPHPILAKEGWPFIAIALGLVVASVALTGFGWVTWLLLIVLVFVVQFFWCCHRPTGAS